MKRIAGFVLLAGLCWQASAFDAFTVQDIRIDGLERISAGTVFTYLPVQRGDNVDRERAASAIRALYKTGFFKDVQLSRQGSILVVTVVERPAISKITLTGNKDLKTEDLLKALKEIGLSEGETFDRLQLDKITQELFRQYNNRGKYNVTIDPKVVELDRNRVDVTITIAEGKAARIRHLNIVGNENFSDDDIREEFESDETNWLSWYSRDDQYSREKVSGDLEKLTSFYQDRGYVDFNIESTQVAISPDKRDIYLTANIVEGDVYTVSELKLTGDLILPAEQLERLIFSKPGDTFNRARLEATSEAIKRTLGNIGYAFAEVTPIPEADKENNTVKVNFFVAPGQRVYVRRIVFEGNTRTEDEVLRREMRQLEGAWYSQASVDRSKVRLQRLGFFKEVDIETPKVTDATDQVDVVVKVEEQSAGAFQFGLGYSELQGLLTSVSVTQRNFLGTGNTIGLTAQSNSIVKRFDFQYLDPYFTDEGISLGYNLSYRELDQGEANIARYTTDTAAGEVLVGIPISEVDTVNFSLGLEKTDITTIDLQTPAPLIQFLVDELGDRERFPCLDNPMTDTMPNTCQNPGPARVWTVNTWRLQAGWARDSRNRFFAPTRGSLQRIGAEIALPGSDLEYFKLNYQYARYFPVVSWLTLLTNVSLGYGDGYGDTDILPFYENFYAGGTRSVRGFEDNTLGPCDPVLIGNIQTFCQPLGGSLSTTGSLELIFPTPFAKRGQDSTQLSAFVDVGNVFADFDSFETDELRASAGLSFKWQAPVGPIIINVAVPLIDKEGDRTETIQFAFGSAF